MCQFVSWVEKKGAKGNKILFLTDALLDTPKGQATLKKYKTDICGHSAIRYYFGLGEGIERFEAFDRECGSFSTPDNFPPEIVKAIKDGQLSQIGVLPDYIFTVQGFRKVKAYAERMKADAECKKAYAEWEKADAEWEKADAEWEKAYAERMKAYAEWEKADAECKKAYAEIRWKVFADPKKRIKVWR